MKWTFVVYYQPLDIQPNDDLQVKLPHISGTRPVISQTHTFISGTTPVISLALNSLEFQSSQHCVQQYALPPCPLVTLHLKRMLVGQSLDP